LDLPLRPPELNSAVKALLYVTPRDSLRELVETSKLCSGNSRLCGMLFRAQWQDIIVAADECPTTPDRLSGILLREVSAFLKARGLEYFSGWNSICIPSLSKEDGRFFHGQDTFIGFSMLQCDSLTAAVGSFYGTA